MTKNKLLANIFPLISVLGCFLISIISKDHASFEVLLRLVIFYVIGMFLLLLAFGNFLKARLGPKKNIQDMIFGVSWVFFIFAFIIALLSHKLTRISGINITFNCATSVRFFLGGSSLMWVYLYLNKTESPKVISKEDM